MRKKNNKKAALFLTGLILSTQLGQVGAERISVVGENNVGKENFDSRHKVEEKNEANQDKYSRLSFKEKIEFFENGTIDKKEDNSENLHTDDKSNKSFEDKLDYFEKTSKENGKNIEIGNSGKDGLEDLYTDEKSNMSFEDKLDYFENISKEDDKDLEIGNSGKDGLEDLYTDEKSNMPFEDKLDYFENLSKKDDGKLEKENINDDLDFTDEDQEILGGLKTSYDDFREKIKGLVDRELIKDLENEYTELRNTSEGKLTGLAETINKAHLNLLKYELDNKKAELEVEDSKVENPTEIVEFTEEDKEILSGFKDAYKKLSVDAKQVNSRHELLKVMESYKAVKESNKGQLSGIAETINLSHVGILREEINTKLSLLEEGQNTLDYYKRESKAISSSLKTIENKDELDKLYDEYNELIEAMEENLTGQDEKLSSIHLNILKYELDNKKAELKIEDSEVENPIDRVEFTEEDKEILSGFKDAYKKLSVDAKQVNSRHELLKVMEAYKAVKESNKGQLSGIAETINLSHMGILREEIAHKLSQLESEQNTLGYYKRESKAISSGLKTIENKDELDKLYDEYKELVDAMKENLTGQDEKLSSAHLNILKYELDNKKAELEAEDSPEESRTDESDFTEEDQEILGEFKRAYDDFREKINSLRDKDLIKDLENEYEDLRNASEGKLTGLAETINKAHLNLLKYELDNKKVELEVKGHLVEELDVIDNNTVLEEDRDKVEKEDILSKEDDNNLETKENMEEKVIIKDGLDKETSFVDKLEEDNHLEIEKKKDSSVASMETNTAKSTGEDLIVKEEKKAINKAEKDVIKLVVKEDRQNEKMVYIDEDDNLLSNDSIVYGSESQDRNLENPSTNLAFNQNNTNTGVLVTTKKENKDVESKKIDSPSSGSLITREKDIDQLIEKDKQNWALYLGLIILLVVLALMLIKNIRKKLNKDRQ